MLKKIKIHIAYIVRPHFKSLLVESHFPQLIRHLISPLQIPNSLNQNQDHINIRTQPRHFCSWSHLQVSIRWVGLNLRMFKGVELIINRLKYNLG